MLLAGGKLNRPLRPPRRAFALVPLLCALMLGGGLSGSPPGAAAATQHQKKKAPPDQLPSNFFGISPNEGLPTSDEFARMYRGGIRSYRIPLGWSTAWPNPGYFNWKPFDHQVAGAVAAGLNVLPVVYSTPPWVASSPANLPVDTLIRRDLWEVFLMRAVGRYGPRGRFWRAHPTLPYKPIRSWQIWNEENAVWFTDPVSVSNYARLLKISHRALKLADPGAKVVLGGLYGRPSPTGGAIWADDFLSRLYQVKGIKSTFDAVGLHPYAADVDGMRAQILDLRSVMKAAGDADTPVWIDEFGWGSGYDRLYFDKGPEGQKTILVDALQTLIDNRRNWNIGRTYWFAWEDVPPPACYYCSTSGLFTSDLTPKPAWYGYVQVARGQP